MNGSQAEITVDWLGARLLQFQHTDYNQELDVGAAREPPLQFNPSCGRVPPPDRMRILPIVNLTRIIYILSGNTTELSQR